ncbi:MAG: MliC family protein [Dysgonamonadaceae bacterium]|jgi:membrane-bound inhibitor of C-type lysozyme|nr:MliC family protein [Dysgonamonadaceae bacterium]
MAKKILTIALLSGFIFASCKNAPKQEAAPAETTPVETALTEEIVTDSVADKNGVKLYLSFNNTQNTASLVLNGDTVELKGDTVASGIRYSNAQYVFTEHQGNITLTKDGTTVFEATEAEE